MKDFLGNPLEIGDRVVFMAIGYRDLQKGTIKNLSPKKATITPDDGRQVMQFYNQIIKIPAQP